jgi:hypothetical protein
MDLSPAEQTFLRVAETAIDLAAQPEQGEVGQRELRRLLLAAKRRLPDQHDELRRIAVEVAGQDEFLDLTGAAFLAILGADRETDLNVLRRWLAHSFYEVRMYAAYAIATRPGGPGELVVELTTGLADPVPQVRRAAALALMAVPNERLAVVHDRLLMLCRHGDPLLGRQMSSTTKPIQPNLGETAMRIVITDFVSDGTCEYSGKKGECLRVVLDANSPPATVSTSHFINLVRFQSQQEAKERTQANP